MNHILHESKNILKSLKFHYGLNIPYSNKSLINYFKIKNYNGGYQNLFQVLLDYPVTNDYDNNSYKATSLKDLLKNYDPKQYSKEQLRDYYINVIYAENLKNKYGIELDLECQNEIKLLENCLYNNKEKITFVPISNNKKIIEKACKKEVHLINKCIKVKK